MKRIIVFLGAMSAVFGQTGLSFSQEYHLIGAAEVYTLVNLHPDENNRRLYSVNYLQPGLIPLCTRVSIESVTSRRMIFRLTDSGREYSYLFHDTMRDPIPRHLDRFFGKTCDKNKIETMSKLDREGILQGRVIPGMTKAAVILAIGFPPEHATPNLEANAWRYWKSRFDTILVHFEEGKVVRIRD